MQCNRQTTDRQRGEQALRDHEAGLRRAQQMAKLAHVITGAAGEFLTWSETLPTMIGRDAAAMPGSTRAWLELLHPEDRERVRRIMIQAAKTGTAAVLEYRLQRMPGESVHIRQVIEPIDSEQDPKEGRRWFNTLQDVTAEKQAAQTLQASEERYRATFEQAAVGIVHSSLEGELRLVNQTFCVMTGYSRAEALQFNIRDITHPQDMGPSTDRRMKIVEGSGTPYQRELRLLSKDGSYLWVSVTTSLVRGADGKPLHFVSVLSDISDRKRVEEEVNRFRAAMDVSVESIFLTDPKTMRFLYVNDTACRKLGYTREQLLQKAPFELIGKTREQLSSEDDEVIAAGERGTRTETPYVRSDGSEGWTDLYRRALCTESGMVIVTIARDITERRAQQQKIERLSRVHAVLSGINAAIVRIRYRALLLRETCRIAVEQGGFGLVWLGLLDRAANEIKVAAHHGFEPHGSAEFAVAFGESGGTLSSTAWQAMTERRPVWSNDIASEPARNPIRTQAIARGFQSAISLPLVTAGESVGVLILFANERDFFDAEEVKLLTELAADISLALENIDKEEKLQFLAHFDPLTGLPNRALFRQRLSQMLVSAKHARTHTTVALTDIKRFRQINETFGREMGEELLREFAQRLRGFWPEPEKVARVGSDSFALVLSGSDGMHDAVAIAATLEKYLKQTLAAPFAMGDKEIRISLSVGVAVYPTDGEDADVLFRNAEAALKKAKASGQRILFYQLEMNARVTETLMLENRLHRAIEQDQFVLHYQPKIESATGRVIGMEALLRWQDPDSGLVSPGEFIPILEETGMILEVGAWAIRKALTESRTWRPTHGGPFRIAVNVSPVQLKQRDFVGSVERAMDGLGVAGSRLDLELTESMIMDDVDGNVRKLAAIHDILGVDIALDDFGTGHSSLAYLAKLPVNALKIDRSFVATMTTNSHSMTLVSTIISLAHALDLKVIAEGVESEDQAKLLRLLKCDEMQGYLFSRPLPADRVVAFLQRADIPR